MIAGRIITEHKGKNSKPKKFYCNGIRFHFSENLATTFSKKLISLSLLGSELLSSKQKLKVFSCKNNILKFICNKNIVAIHTF